jgi:O-antigen/teichoic acid export membrane protein
MRLRLPASDELRAIRERMNVPVFSPEKSAPQSLDSDAYSVPRRPLSAGRQTLIARLLALLGSIGLRDSLIMAIAMGLAGGLDYAVSLLAGRWLVPVEYGVFIAVAAVMQVLAQLTNTIRNVVAFYTAELSSRRDSPQGVAGFVQRVWRWGWRWGLPMTMLMAAISPALGRALRLPNAWPLWAATPVVLLFFIRTITDGALQGLQSFGGFGAVQFVQSLLRLIFAAGLIWLGFQAAGAIIALPLAMAAVLMLALWLLRPYFRNRTAADAQRVSWHYSSYTLLGLAAFAVLSNMDALFVKHFFSPTVAGDYGPVVTLAKMSLFVPLALGIVLFAKATKRRASGRDPRPLLLLALAATLLPGFALTGVYFLFPGFIVHTIFTAAYANPGVILGMANLAASLYAGLNIWLNYALSLNRPSFIYILVGILLLQIVGMYLFGRDSLIHMTLIMVSAGLVGNLAGFATTWAIVPMPKVAIAPTSF